MTEVLALSLPLVARLAPYDRSVVTARFPPFHTVAMVTTPAK